jgi:pimeloyl-ACP methyl ester carboxylesterase
LSRSRAAAVLALLAVLAVVTVLVRSEAPAHPSGSWLRSAAVEPSFAQVDGVRIRYVRRGSGPPLVLLHGIAASIYSWRYLIPALTTDHDVLAIDLPGFGGSDQPPDLSWELYARVVPALLQRLDVERPILIGHSMGGAVAVMLAAPHPERFSGLVLIDSAGYNLRRPERPLLLRLAAVVPPFLVERLPRRALVEAGLRQVFHERSKVTEDVVEEYLAPLARPGAVAAMRSLLDSRNDAVAPRVEEAIASLRLPTLVLWGRDDRWAPPAHALRFAAAIPGAQLLVLKDCGHMPQEERPDAVLDAVRPFLEQVEKGGLY